MCLPLVDEAVVGAAEELEVVKGLIIAPTRFT